MNKKQAVALLVAANVVCGIILLNSCSFKPTKAKPIKPFDANRYLGTWYEVARLDYRFEKNLDNASAQYSLNNDGTIKVLNSGFNYKKNKWQKAEGVAKFRDENGEAALKVSFFKPFYAGYNVIAIDENYKYALVAGSNLKYLWLLSREKNIPEPYKTNFLELARSIGYETDNLIWVDHNRTDNPYLK